MKTIKLFVMMAVLSLMAMSCSEDEETTIAGSEFESIYIKIETTMEGGSVVIEYDTKELIVSEGIYQTLSFEVDGEFLVNDESIGTWTESGDAITISSDGEDTNATLTGSQLTINESWTEDDSTVELTYIYSKI